jgi:hypothetical protein
VTRFERTIELDVPAEDAWAFVSDPHRSVSAITAGQASVRLLAGTFDTVGSRYVITVLAGSTTSETEHEITRYAPPRTLETLATTRGTVARTSTRIEPVGPDRCRLTLMGEMRWGWSLPHVLGRFVNTIFGGVFLRHALTRLGAAITEASAQGAASVGSESQFRQEG